MEKLKDELENLIWVSRFWTLYNQLPESLKKGFCSLVNSFSKELEEKGIKQGVEKIKR